MSEDMRIFDSVPGLVDYELPDYTTVGEHKLLQRVVVLLFADDGELIKYIGGRANIQSLTEDVLVRETGRVSNTIMNDTPVDAPSTEILSELDILLLDHSDTRARIDLSVVSEDSNTDSVIVTL